MSRVPDFIIVGAAKSGTSSLANYLDRHPLVDVVSIRLEHFGEFSNPSTGGLSRGEYLGLFKDVPTNVMVGEKSVSYLYSKSAPREIHEFNPAMKIVMILRDPVQRAYSDFWHRKREGKENLSFGEALAAEPGRIADGAGFAYHYATYGLYASGVEAYINQFGRENVCAFRYEDIQQNPAAVCRTCFGFLGVEPEFGVNDFPVYNKGGQINKNSILRILQRMAQDEVSVKMVRALLPTSIRSRVTGWMTTANTFGKYPPLSSEVESSLRPFFSEDVLHLESLLGWDLAAWK